MSPRALLFAAVFSAAIVVGAQQDQLLRTDKLREATALLNQFVTERKIAGAVAGVWRKSEVAYLQAVGFQNLETRSPMTERSLFRIYSMTKPVTAVAVMILLEEGRFRLNDPVSKYLPEFAEAKVRAPNGATRAPSRNITVEDLLLHTSGLNHRTSESYRSAQVRSRSIDLPQFIRNIVRVPLMEDPGTVYRYSEATTVLGRLVEVWSGKPFDVFLNERVLRPLSMNDTTFQVGSEQQSRLATVYAPAPGGGLVATEIETVPFTERPALIEGAVGLVSTVPDYLRFSQMLLNRGEFNGQRILSANTVETMARNGLSAAILADRGGSMGWGLANVNVALDPVRGGEYGWDGTAGTIFWINPATETITILMTQSSPANPDGLRQRFKRIIDEAVVTAR